jgi:hypothetical protein
MVAVLIPIAIGLAFSFVVVTITALMVLHSRFTVERSRRR